MLLQIYWQNVQNKWAAYIATCSEQGNTGVLYLKGIEHALRILFTRRLSTVLSFLLLWAQVTCDVRFYSDGAEPPEKGKNAPLQWGCPVTKRV